jgi:hypothetical protein
MWNASHFAVIDYNAVSGALGVATALVNDNDIVGGFAAVI